MKLAITSLLALASLALAQLSINNPTGATVWPSNNTPVSVTWISLDGSPLTGDATVELMEGLDQGNLNLVLKVGTVPAAARTISFTPPANLPKSNMYAVRVTANGVPRYSHSFQAGNPAIAPKGSESSAAAPSSSSSAAPSSSSASPSSSSAAPSSSSASPSSAALSSSTLKSATKSSSARSSTDEKSSKSHEKSSESEESSESEDSLDLEESESSGASRPVIAAGLLGVVAIAAMF
ncbi:hypothetical protein LPJ61_001530 [Coemansia biformis]|uniref:Yeast cell wall synthesis Kre9/Knh1-like N-terminal domain-containing protein n=1 Tax=Coemansia biformis TaxID=1286918 RepID=A0A9W7YG79_9FUNG|nr:hypothetical protein LPJ61_001530 [Coemansia biformis]